jgi:sterol desaturase/sphingolipid hydroxylase (fatty acid hydroxylase superfamily)
MNMLIIFGIAVGCVLAERLWPAMELPRVNAWWARVILINAIQLGITVLAGQTWNRWLDHASILRLKDHFNDWSSAAIVYFFSTFVYYWWHRIGMNRHFYGGVTSDSSFGSSAGNRYQLLQTPSGNFS